MAKKASSNGVQELFPATAIFPAVPPAPPPRIAPLKPTAVYDTYWRFAAERQAIQGVSVTKGGVLLNLSDNVVLKVQQLTEAGGTPRLCASTGVACAPEADLWPLREVSAAQRARRVEDVASRLPGERAALPRAALVLPLEQAGQEAVAGPVVVVEHRLQILSVHGSTLA